MNDLLLLYQPFIVYSRASSIGRWAYVVLEFPNKYGAKIIEYDDVDPDVAYKVTLLYKGDIIGHEVKSIEIEGVLVGEHGVYMVTQFYSYDELISFLNDIKGLEEDFMG